MEEESENALGLVQEQSDIEEQLVKLKEDMETAKEELSASEELEQKTQEEIKELTSKLDEKRAEESEALSKVNSYEVEVQKMRQAASFKQANLDRIDSELAKSDDELKSVLKAIEDNENLVEEKKKNIQEI